jgi:hypothetical protein
MLCEVELNGRLPTMPNKMVNTTSRKPLANDQNGITHPPFAMAVAAVGQTLSTTKEGVVLLIYPQQLN